MEQPANGLSATSAYDLACRYNSLFQYSPAAAAACAAAYGMFGSGSGSKNGPIGSSSSPFQPLGAIATSSLPSSSSSNLTSSPTSSLSSLVSNHSKQEPLPPPPPSTHKPVAQPPLDKSNELADECDAKSRTHNNSYENVSDNGSEHTDTNSDDEAEHNLSSLSECVEEDDDKEELVDVDVQTIQQKLNTEAEKSIAACVDQIQASLDEDKPLEQLDDENKKSSSACSLVNEEQQCSIGSLMHTLSVKHERACFKFGSIEFDALRKSLVDSVTQAIESTLDTFSKRDTKQHTPNNNTTSTGNSNSNTNSASNKQDKHKLDPRAYQTQSAPKRIRVNEKISKTNSLNNNSQNFNVSKILSKESSGHTGASNGASYNSTGYMNGINNAHMNMNTNKRKLSESFAAGFGSSSLLQTKAGLASPAQSLLSTNLNNLNNQKQHFSPFYSAMPGVPYGSGGALPPMGSGASTPSTHSAAAASTNGSITSLFAAHQHQLLMAAAQAAAASGQNANYLQMAAAANRLFTPYLIDQHTSHSAKPNAPSSSASSAIFHSPHKRRRTKVTDTRLSPRNPLLRAKNRDESPTNDDHEHDNDYDDEHPHNHHTHHNNQEDDSASSGCNESGSTTGSNCRIANTYHNNIYDTNTETTDYTGYQTSTLSSLHLRKAKLMFFFSRYPSSTILRNFFPDVKFNKANTAQLVKWFSNFREFFYIQMEKFARQHLAEGMRNADDILVDCESEIFRALNSHYNRNNQLEIPASFCFVIQATLREFFKAIQEGKDMDPSWKKAIYKIIARMDDQIPEYFKSVQWMESLETNI